MTRRATINLRLGIAWAAVMAVAACAPMQTPAPSTRSTTIAPTPSPSPFVPSNEPQPPAETPSPPVTGLPPSAAPSTDSLPARLLADAAGGGAAFPLGFRAYHTYASMSAEIATIARAHPGLVRVFSIGRSYEGRDIWAARISQDVSHDHGRPEILFDGLHHALEHLSLEMTLAIFGWLAGGYGHDANISRLLDTRVVDIVFAVNPDGAEYDIAGGHFHGWRKNRQPTPGSTAIGTDLNRNYDDHWSCCGLVSTQPASAYYEGPSAFSAPESIALADFVRSRVVHGQQRIRVAISFHTSGRLVMWPYAYTTEPVPPDMAADDHAVFVAMGKAMAATNGYRPEQASGLYVDSGSSTDWEYGREHVFAFTFELGVGPDSIIGPETSRNRAAVLYAISLADCPYRAIGKAAQYCPAA